MQSRTISRELALLMLGQTSDRGAAAPALPAGMEGLLQQVLATISQDVRESLDRSAEDLQTAQQQLLDSELQEQGEQQLPRVRQHLNAGLAAAEQALNRLSASLELPRLLMLADQDEVRLGAIARVEAVLRDRQAIDGRLDRVMEGWRLTRLPRIDRDILRLAAVDLESFRTPLPWPAMRLWS